MNPAIIGARIDVVLLQQVFIPPQAGIDILFDIFSLVSPRRSWGGKNALDLSLSACRTGMVLVTFHFSSGTEDTRMPLPPLALSGGRGQSGRVAARNGIWAIFRAGCHLLVRRI